MRERSPKGSDILTLNSITERGEATDRHRIKQKQNKAARQVLFPARIF